MYQNYFTPSYMQMIYCVLLNGKDYLSLIASLNSELDKLSI